MNHLQVAFFTMGIFANSAAQTHLVGQALGITTTCDESISKNLGIFTLAMAIKEPRHCRASPWPRSSSSKLEKLPSGISTLGIL